MLRQRSTLIIAISLLILISILFCIPGKEFPKSGWLDRIWFDKWVHAGLFFILVFAWCRVIRSADSVFRKITFGQLAIIALVYGIMMEVVQEYFIPNRSFEVSDILADGLGCLAGYVFVTRKWKIK